MIKYPNIPKSFLTIGNLELRWYGLFYLITFVIAYFVIKKLSKNIKFKNLRLTNQDIIDILFWAVLGVIIGSRLGYVFFYNWQYYSQNLLKIFYIWEGGMSFHGGLLGVVLAESLYAIKNKIYIWQFADLLVLPAPIGLALGRLGNFINAELYGRITSVPWCMEFPRTAEIETVFCRHPSQIYAFFLEGILLFLILWLVKNKIKNHGIIFSLFLILYGCFRIFLEFFREPDAHLGFILYNWITMGQLLSFVMLILGIIIFIYCKTSKNAGKISET